MGATTLLLACGPGDARFKTKSAAGFSPDGHAVSVFGVYKDGRMSSDAWETIEPRVSRALGATACGAAYGGALMASNAALASAIDDYARSNGPTDELLDQLAPSAKGDVIVVFTLAGQVPSSHSKDGAARRSAASTTVGPPTGSNGRGGGGMRRPERDPGFSPEDTNELDISASFYSVPQKRSVGLVAMQYVGESVDDAIVKFAAALARFVPNARCTGWDWNADLDPQRIRDSIER